jgi:hypothetical protein
MILFLYYPTSAGDKIIYPASLKLAVSAKIENLIVIHSKYTNGSAFLLMERVRRGVDKRGGFPALIAEIIA